MQKSINGNFYIVLDQIIKQLQDIQNEQKDLIKTGTKITNCTYGAINVNSKQRATYSKDDQKLLDTYAMSIGLAKKVTHYNEVKATASTTAVNKAQKQVTNLLKDIAENDTVNIAKVATAILNASK